MIQSIVRCFIKKEGIILKLLNLGLGILGAAAIGEAALATYFFRLTILRKDKPMVDKSEMGAAKKFEGYKGMMDEAREWADRVGFEEVDVTSRDGLKLHGYYFDNPGSDKLVICFHGYTSKGFNECPSFAKAYYEMGYSALIVDNRAHGKSEGKYVGFGILDRFDALEWIKFGIQRMGEDVQIVLHGDSMGGSTALMVTGFPDLPENIKAVVADCGFTSPEAVFSHILKRDYHIPKEPLMSITSAMSRKLAGYGYSDYTTLEAVKVSKTPTLFACGDEDTFVPTWMTQENYDACVAPKRLFWVHGAGHAAAFFEDNELFMKELKDFLSKYVK